VTCDAKIGQRERGRGGEEREGEERKAGKGEKGEEERGGEGPPTRGEREGQRQGAESPNNRFHGMANNDCIANVVVFTSNIWSVFPRSDGNCKAGA